MGDYMGNLLEIEVKTRGRKQKVEFSRSVEYVVDSDLSFFK